MGGLLQVFGGCLLDYFDRGKGEGLDARPYSKAQTSVPPLEALSDLYL